MILYYVMSLSSNTMYEMIRLRDTLGPYPAAFREPIKRQDDDTFILELWVDDPSWEALIDTYCGLAGLEIVRKEHVPDTHRSRN